jgi:hypothetical protein
MADNEKIFIDSATFKFWQDSDSDSEELVQEVEVKFKDTGAGLYPVIKTEEWSVNEIEELTVFFNKLKKLEEALKECELTL